MAKDFQFIQLSKDSISASPRPFDGMAAGDFVDMMGQEVSLKAKDFPQYLANTLANLETTRDSAGNIVGLPITFNGHTSDDAAGWITGIQLSPTTPDKFQFYARWNEKGAELISGDLQRFFSPTIDTENKYIAGGSLTNWPATRTKQGQLLLGPVELSQGVYTNEFNPQQESGLLNLLNRVLTRLSNKPGIIEPEPSEDNMIELANLKPEEKEKLLAEARAQLASGSSTELAALVNAKAVEMAASMLAEAQRKQHVKEFAASIVGGTPDAPTGMMIDSAALIVFMDTLTPEQTTAAEALITSMKAAAMSEYQEKGHGKQLSNTQPLPGWAKPLLTSWLSVKGNTVASFFAANPEVGEMSGYNLSEFKEA